jgi:hypothetical protein
VAPPAPDADAEIGEVPLVCIIGVGIGIGIGIDLVCGEMEQALINSIPIPIATPTPMSDYFPAVRNKPKPSFPDVVDYFRYLRTGRDPAELIKQRISEAQQLFHVLSILS